MDQHFETIVIGAGPAGLVMGRHLARHGQPFVILEGADSVGDPGHGTTADPAEYAGRFELPVRTGHRVDGVFREGDRYLVTSGRMRLTADNIVVATGARTRPHLPAFAPLLKSTTVQLHARDYRNPSQLADGPVLIVGRSKLAADIALELAGSRQVFLSGNAAGPATGVRVPRTVGVVAGRPELEDGRVLSVANVIWCTGLRADYSWLCLDGIDKSRPLPSERGAVTGRRGLFVLGNEFQHALNSHTTGGAAPDAAGIATQIQKRRAAVAF